MSASIIKIDSFLIVTVHSYMDDNRALELSEEIGQSVVELRSEGVLLDISSLDILDSFMARLLANMAAMARLLGARTVLVGMRPEVALTLVDLGLELPGIITARNVEAGLTVLRRFDDGS